MNGPPLAVVTGGAGFIGSHMVDLLVDQGFRVHVIDSLIGGRFSNLVRHQANPDVSLDERDVRALVPNDAVFAGAQLVFYFAGIGDIVPLIERSIEYLLVNA